MLFAAIWVDLEIIILSEVKPLLSFTHSVMTDSCDPMGCSPQAPLSMGFSGQEYWSELPFPPPRDLPNSAIEPMSPRLLQCRRILYC